MTASEDRLREYLKRATADLRWANQRLSEIEGKDHEPIAIIGMGCRFPGGVQSPDDLWSLVADGKDAIGDFPVDRGWDTTGLGGFLADAALFDAEFFTISPREALAMDPQQRVLLETSWETVERAGIDPKTLRGSDTGVFAGVISQDYVSRPEDLPEHVQGHLMTGNTPSVASGRVAYTLGLEGPAVTVDTACSSSLVAVHLAVQSLRRGECSLALAGGVTIMATPVTFAELSRQRGLASDGRCKSFAASADGTGLSEGAGLLLLERLSDARRNGHTVLAVIRGSAINHDGSSNGLTAPSRPAQERVIRQALSDSDLRPSDVDVVEAHGTGTTLGDPIEAHAVLATYGQDRTTPVYLGSIKSNIGHTQAAAGVAGVLKMVMAMRHGTLPESLHIDEPTPHVEWTNGSVTLLTENTPWPDTSTRRAAVSSFGISGTNAHLIVEQADTSDWPAPQTTTFHRQRYWLSRTPDWRLDLTAPGSLDNVTRVSNPEANRPLAPKEIRVALSAAGLNFRDVLIALGRYPGNAVIGSEASGTVLETGSDVTAIRPGQRVMGLFAGAIATTGVTDHRIVIPVPEGWTDAEAAAAPVAYVTAYHALTDINPGDKVLVHTATGGVGMAAINIARQRGADIYATAHPTKWDTLRALGIPDDHMASSRTTQFEHRFADHRFTVVINTLTGELLDASLRMLADGGKLVDLTKSGRDDAVDISTIPPDDIQRMLTDLFTSDAPPPLPTTTWPAHQATQALRRFSQEGHTGKIALTIHDAAPEQAEAAAAHDFTELVRREIAAALDMSISDVVDTKTFTDLGFDSLSAIDFHGAVSTATGLDLPTTLIFDYPTPAQVVRYLETAGKPTENVVPAQKSTEHDPIVIIGIGCRYPGGVRSPEDLWNLVVNGTDAIGDFPTDRGWTVQYDPDPDTPHASFTRRGGFLHDAADFDAGFFAISPHEALAMDPQHRLLLETTWETFEHAQIDPATLHGSNTGVFAGVIAQDYVSGIPADLEGHLVTGNTPSVASGRIAYTFGLRGPALTIDTACSSSLVALHLAAQSLRQGECSMALAGGVTVMAKPGAFTEFSRQRVLSSDGRCKAFSADADGTGFAEGVGLVLLERLSDARRNGHSVLAVVRGSAVNSDGASNGLTAPNGPSQEQVIRQALADARLQPSEVDAIEAHGTGTVLGDPIEARALQATYAQNRTTPVHLGSIKSNIGHTQAAAGVAGVIKMTMAMHHGQLPPTLHIGQPTPHIDWANGLSLLTENTPWPDAPNVASDAPNATLGAHRPRRAAISSFGISGTNSHVILEQAPPVEVVSTEVKAGAPWLISAKAPDAVRAQAEELRSYLAANPAIHPTDVAYTLATGRAKLDHRAAVTGETRAELIDGLTALARGETADNVRLGNAASPGKTVFVFPGQGSQWVGMAAELLDSSEVFRDAIKDCERVLAPYIEWSLRDVLRGKPGAASMERVDVIQPTLFAMMVSLAKLWRSLGVEPDAVIGHSQGEIAAAHIAGALSLEDAARVIALRSRALIRVSGEGGLLAVQEPPDRVADRIARYGLEIAAVNGPAATVVSGDRRTLDELVDACTAEGVRTYRILSNTPGHSRHVEPLHEELLTVLARITPRTSDLAFYSTVSGGPADTAGLDAEYWYRNMRETVRFEQASRALLDDGYRVFVEISPHPTLTTALQQNFDGTPGATTVHTLQRENGSWASFLGSVAQADTCGATVDWSAALAWFGASRVHLPTYAFQRDRYWLADRAPEPDRTTAQHPILNLPIDLAGSESVLFSGRIALATHPWLADHAVQGTVLLPGFAFLELAFQAGAHIRELTIEAPLVLADDSFDLQIMVRQNREVVMHARRTGETTWTQHASGILDEEAPSAPQWTESWPPVGGTPIPLDDLYDHLTDRGYEYGAAFQCLSAAWRRGEDIFTEVTLPADDHARFSLHPALLDAACHPLAADTDQVLLPFAWSGAHLHATGATTLRVRLSRTGENTISLAATDTTGAPVVTIDSLTLRRPPEVHNGILFEIDSVPVALPTADPLPEVVFLSEGTIESARETTGDALRVVREHLTSSSRLAIVTSGLAHAAARGLIRSAQAEAPGRFVLVDIDVLDSSRDALAAALSTDEPELSLREGKAYAPRLRRVTGHPANESGLDPQGTVLITGGTGEVGNLIARHLIAEHGVRHLILASRSGIASTEFDADVRIARCDVADREAVAELLATIPAEHPLTAIVHAAGIMADGIIESITPQHIDDVFRPKVDGAWHLHNLTKDMDLAAFILFSSAAGTVGSPGQGAYAAGNSFLDDLARYRRDLGLPATALAWGLIPTETGMSSGMTDADHRRLADAGINPLSTADVLALFDAAVRADRPVIVPARLDLTKLRDHNAALVRDLVRTPARRTAPLRNRLTGLPETQQREQVLDMVRAALAVVLGHSQDVEPDFPFVELGVDSLAAVRLRNRLDTETGLRLPVTMIFEHPTPAALTDYLLTHLKPAARAASVTTVDRPDPAEPIAVIGMACRYPGDVRSPEQLWNLVSQGRDAISDFPADRGWDLAELYDPDPAREGTSYARSGGFLHDAAGFDPGFFRISPREAYAMDPQHRLLLETAWEAFERAGITPESQRGSQTGVFTGLMYNDYATRLDRIPAGFGGLLGTGSASSVASGRVAYTLDLKGPTVTVDTACSSSLVAVHLAAQSLRLGECSLALAGGATVLASPNVFVEFSRQRGLSPDGRCKAFSASANGTGLAEGAGVLLLERLSDAVRNNHPILAVVRGSAINQDGAGNGLTAPNGGAQEQVILRALANAGLRPSEVDAIEAHGTGTALGDPIEAQALQATYGQGRATPAYVGSIKSNIGHTQAAAGVAGIIKMVMAMRHGQLPGSLHIDEPTPHVDWTNGSVTLLTKNTPWPDAPNATLGAHRPRRAGISSFGISGTNAHLIIEQPPVTGTGSRTVSGPVAWPLSAKSAAGLRAQAQQLHAFLTANTDLHPADIGHSLATTRTAFRHRAVITGDGRDDLLAGLDALTRGEDTPAIVRGRLGKVAFLFSGQGSQRLAMGRELYDTYPVFADAFNEVCAHFDTSPKEIIFGTDAAELEETTHAQPALFALEVALYRLLEHHGLTPDFVLGHSVGELAAAHVAGVLSLADACTLTAARGELMQSMPRGAMVAVEASEDQVLASIAGRDDTVSIAAVNGPRSTVISGDAQAVEEVAAQWREWGYRTSQLRVSHAFHSHHMDGMLEEFRQVAEKVTFSAGDIPIVSTLTGVLDTPSNADYWTDQLRRPVRFADGMRCLQANGVTTFIEVGPDGVLAALGQACLDQVATFLPVLRTGKNEPGTFVTALAAAHAGGAQVRWPSSGQRIDLPTYAFQRERYWLDVDTEVDMTPPADSEPVPLRDRLNGASDAEKDEILFDLVRAHMKAVLGLEPADVDDGFTDLGLSSVAGLQLAGLLAADTGLSLPPSVIYDHPTPAALVQHVRAQLFVETS